MKDRSKLVIFMVSFGVLLTLGASVYVVNEARSKNLVRLKNLTIASLASAQKQNNRAQFGAILMQFRKDYLANQPIKIDFSTTKAGSGKSRTWCKNVSIVLENVVNEMNDYQDCYYIEGYKSQTFIDADAYPYREGECANYWDAIDNLVGMLMNGGCADFAQ